MTSHAPWLKTLKEEAAGHFEALGLPNRHHESWRYTNLRAIRPVLEASSTALPDQGPIELGSIADALGDEAAQIVFVDGRYQPQFSTSAIPEGVHFAPFEANAGTQPPEMLGSVSPKDDALSWLNLRDLTGGVLLRVEPGVKVTEPIVLIFLSLGATDEAQTSAHIRILVDAGHHSELTLVERHVGHTEATCLTNTVAEVRLAEGARLTHVKVQREGSGTRHLGSCFVHQGASSAYHSHVLSLGSHASRTDLRTWLQGPGAEVSLEGLYMGTAQQDQDHYTEIHHVAPHTTSHELYKGILDDQAVGSFQGRVLIHKGARGSAADQLNRNLVLSEGAQVNTKPQLEIDNDDVKAAHGATTGQLDKDALFYLCSRGIDPETARQILIIAFAQEIIERLPLDSLKPELRDLVRARLGPVVPPH
jgi:Fe-S cluster assembly protein SufD